MTAHWWTHRCGYAVLATGITARTRMVCPSRSGCGEIGAAGASWTCDTEPVYSAGDYTAAADLLDALPVLLRTRRAACDLSLRAVAAQAGLGTMTVRRAEYGDGITAQTAAALMRWLAQPATRTQE
jgi:fermentation-respiration switch protein FrsA (DUF1100 family)